MKGMAPLKGVFRHFSFNSITVVKSCCTQITRLCALVTKVGVVYVNVHVLRCLKEEVARSIDKWLLVISNAKQNT